MFFIFLTCSILTSDASALQLTCMPYLTVVSETDITGIPRSCNSVISASSILFYVARAMQWTYLSYRMYISKIRTARAVI